MLAIFFPTAAALCIGAEGLNPKGTDRVITTTATAFRAPPIAAECPAQLYLSGSLTVLALGALAVSYATIATLVRDRDWVVATVAALIGGLGAFCGAMLTSWSVSISPLPRRQSCHKQYGLNILEARQPNANSVYHVRRYEVLTADDITSAVTEYADPQPPKAGGEKPARQFAVHRHVLFTSAEFETETGEAQ